jgi:MFS family permease
VWVAVLFATGLIVFPHYQAFAREELVQSEAGREELGVSGVQLMVWVVTQNAAVALFSLVVGPLADRRGYRLVLRLLVFGSAAAPAFAVSLIRLPNHLGEDLFWLVYVALGVTPLVHRTLLNYALEICTPDAHARYQSIVTLGVVIPFLLSPAVGWLIDAIGFESVFMATIVLILLSGLMTFRLDEPRHWAGDHASHGGGVGRGN